MFILRNISRNVAVLQLLALLTEIIHATRPPPPPCRNSLRCSRVVANRQGQWRHYYCVISNCFRMGVLLALIELCLTTCFHCTMSKSSDKQDQQKKRRHPSILSIHYTGVAKVFFAGNFGHLCISCWMTSLSVRHLICLWVGSFTLEWLHIELHL